MKALKNKQKGMTAVSLLALAILLGFILIIAINLLPVYLENFKVASAVQGLASDHRAQGASDDQIRELILKKLDIDDVERIEDEDIEITRSGGMVEVTVAYEARVGILGNVDAIVVFDGETVEFRE